MGLSGPGALTPAEKKAPAWKIGGATILSFVAILYVIEALDTVMGHRLDQDGIRPLEVDGLWGILWAPLLHGGWPHLIANTVPALVLGFLVTLAGIGRFVYATAIIWVLGGLGTWLIGNLGVHCPYVGVQCGSTHIGASGLIFGWLTFLIVFGFFTRTLWQIVVGVVVFFVYGSVLLGVFPGTLGVSWQGHLCGALAGIVAAYVLAGPERKARVRRKAGVPPQLTT
ncbi:MULTISPECIES: rhomboid family intramembrane serine protease [unclassified Mycobacterium]|uniref:rhomboid family intramembrane serine protease n=1 Tax=unclassified Mycobacterium TaxID=2642494 RepID=UPI0029C8C9FC|nr:MULTISPECIES: rhomboid family intramembrane serine protease [unclassified Mycobacterium]